MNELMNLNDGLVTEITEYDTKILTLFQKVGLPAEGVLVSLPERKKVFKNMEDILSLLPADKLKQSEYLSKFLSAVSAGLFDAALNYLWDETVKQLRKRVSSYDIQYFYDLLSLSEQRRSKLRTEEDLSSITDDELINGALKLGVISEIGFRLLDDIKYMRNWASAAHPNQVTITGLQLVSWLETCIREVISLPLSTMVVRINELLKNIKKNELEESDITSIATVFENLTEEKIQSLCNGFFGIYCRNETEEFTRTNIKKLLPKLWIYVIDDTKYQIGIKYGQMKVNGDVEGAAYARSFLEIVNAEKYIPDDLKDAELKNELDNLKYAHNSYNNFYLESQYIKQINNLITKRKISKNIENDLILTVLDAFLTNTHGISWEADDYYKEVINKFNDRQFIKGIACFTHEKIKNKLNHRLCQKKYLEYLAIVKENVTIPSLIDIVEDIEDMGIIKLLNDTNPIEQRLSLLLKSI